MCSVLDFFFFFFKQKTAYEMRISDWSSDVCSSDLPATQCDRESAVLVWHQCRAGHRHRCGAGAHEVAAARTPAQLPPAVGRPEATYRAGAPAVARACGLVADRTSTRLNSSH